MPAMLLSKLSVLAVLQGAWGTRKKAAMMEEPNEANEPILPDLSSLPDLLFPVVKDAQKKLKEVMDQKECASTLPNAIVADIRGTYCRLWPGGSIPGGLSPSKDETGKTNDELINNVADVQVPQMLSFPVEGSDKAFVIGPGGGFFFLAWNSEGVETAKWLNSIGISAFVVKYRVPNSKGLKFGEAALLDAQRAVRLVRHNAATFGIDPAKIGFIGFSAGGYLTSEVATKYDIQKNFNVDAADAVSAKPSLAIMAYSWTLLKWFTNKVKAPVTSETPPTFLVHARDDGVAGVGSSEGYYQKLQEEGVESELHIYDTSPRKSGHGYGVCTVPVPAPKSPEDLKICEWPTLAEEFIRKHWD